MDEALRALGTIDILVNNARTLWAAPAENHPDSSGRAAMGLNIDAVFFVARAIGKRGLLPRGPDGHTAAAPRWLMKILKAWLRSCARTPSGMSLARSWR